MKIQTPRKSPILIGSIVATGLVAAYALTALATNLWPFTDNAVSDPSSNQSTVDNPDSDDDSNTTKGPSPTDKTPKHYEEVPGEQDDADSLSGVINYKSVSEGTLVIRTTIDQRVGSGTCDLTLTHALSGKVVTRSAEIIDNPSSSTCKGFSVPVSDLVETGEWDISITISSGDKQGIISSEVAI